MIKAIHCNSHNAIYFGFTVLKQARTSNRLRTLVKPLQDSNGVDNSAGIFIFGMVVVLL